MLQKDVYLFEYMDSWQRFNKSFLDKKEFYRNLALENITDNGYNHARSVWEDFEI